MPVPPTLTPEALSRLFTGPAPRRPHRAGYFIGLALSAFFLALLPLIYLALTVGAAISVYWHAAHNTWILLEGFSGRTSILSALSYFGPIFIGGLIVAFMIKPLFAPREERDERIVVLPVEQPILHAYVRALCEALNAPVPVRIDVDCSVNAAASFDGAVLAVARRRLTLTLGLPLAAGMSLRQLTGILAHELGHFSQGSAMSLGFFVRSMTAWLARIAYSRDAWDAGLDRQIKTVNYWPVQVVGMLAKFLIAVNRLLLRLLVWTAHAATCYMSRQMEHDADAAEAAIVGSEQFADTTRRMLELSAGWHEAANSLRRRFAEGRLPDNVPLYIAAFSDVLPRELRRAMVESMLAEETGLFSSHPGHRDRISSATSLGFPGVLGADAPASSLFKDFNFLCVRATHLFYRDAIGDDVGKAAVVQTEAFLRELDDSKRQHAGLDEYFGGPAAIARIPSFDTPQLRPPEDAKRTLSAVRLAIERMAEMKSSAVQLGQAWAKAEGLKRAATAFKACTAAKLPPSKELCAALKELPGDPAACLEAANAQTEKALEDLKPFHRFAAQRLIGGLQLLHIPEVRSRIEGGRGDEFLRRAQTLVRFAYECERVRDTAEGISALLASAAELISALPAPGKPGFDSGVSKLDKLSHKVNEHVAAIHGPLCSVPYPFEHERAGLTVGAYLAEKLVPRDAGPAVFGQAEEVIDRLGRVQIHGLAELVEIALSVERVVARPKPAAAAAPAAAS